MYGAVAIAAMILLWFFPAVTYEWLGAALQIDFVLLFVMFPFAFIRKLSRFAEMFYFISAVATIYHLFLLFAMASQAVPGSPLTGLYFFARQMTWPLAIGIAVEVLTIFLCVTFAEYLVQRSKEKPPIPVRPSPGFGRKAFVAASVIAFLALTFLSISFQRKHEAEPLVTEDHASEAPAPAK